MNFISKQAIIGILYSDMLSASKWLIVTQILCTITKLLLPSFISPIFSCRVQELLVSLPSTFTAFLTPTTASTSLKLFLKNTSLQQLTQHVLYHPFLNKDLSTSSAPPIQPFYTYLLHGTWNLSCGRVLTSSPFLKTNTFILLCFTATGHNLTFYEPDVLVY